MLRIMECKNNMWEEDRLTRKIHREESDGLAVGILVDIVIAFTAFVYDNSVLDSVFAIFGSSRARLSSRIRHFVECLNIFFIGLMMIGIFPCMSSYTHFSLYAS